MKCSRCTKEKPEIDFIRDGEVYKNCNACNDERILRYDRQKKGIMSSKELLLVRRENAFPKGNFVCCRCGEEKPLTNFSPDKTGRSKFGKVGFCNQCRSEGMKFSKVKKHHGLDKYDFMEILQEQEGKCKICKVNLETFNQGDNKSNTLCIDHCHDTGKFRGFLCNNCNRAIGLLKDNEQIILEAYKYIAQFKQGELLESPTLERQKEDNQQPSLSSNTFEGSTTNSQVLNEDSNANTSALPGINGESFQLTFDKKYFNFGDDIV